MRRCTAIVRSTSVAAKALPAYLPYFALGMLLALWVERSIALRETEPRVGIAGTLALFIAGPAGVIGNGIWHSSPARDAVPLVTASMQNLPAGLGFAALLVAVVAGRGPATAWIHARPLAALGLVSYGICLWHVLLMLFAVRIGVLPHAFVARLLAVAVPAVAAGTASWYAVERTMLARATRAAAPRRRARRAGIRRELEARAAP